MRLSGKAGSGPGGKLSQRLAWAAAVIAVVLISPSVARAGELIVYNLSSHPITCSVDGYTKASGADADFPFRVEPGQRLNVPPNFSSKSRFLNTADCGGLRTRGMNITPESPDRVLFLNGRQHRVLNSLLYASIPTDPKAGFTLLPNCSNSSRIQFSGTAPTTRDPKIGAALWTRAEALIFGVFSQSRPNRIY
jgi:hypothetical protein